MSYARKTIFINQALPNPNMFSVPINVDFIPDELIIRQVSYYHNGAEGILAFIYSDLISESNILCSVIDTPVSQCLNAKFTITNPIRGNYTFKALVVNNNAINFAGLAGNLTLLLEFVKYEK